MEKDLQNKVAVITGATSGIGRAAARGLAAAGAKLMVVGRSEPALAELCFEIKAVGGEAISLALDVTLDGSARSLVDHTVETYGGIDVLVNAAGTLKSGTIQTTTIDDWDAMMNINVRSVFQLMNAAAPHLAERRGNVVNVSSVTGLRSFPGVLAYCVSKAALDQLTRCSALELAAQGVRVNAVNPGVVVTDIHRRGGMNDEAYAAFLEHSKTTHPLGRVGQPEEIAELILFLASSRAGWITGATYSIDGGRGLTCAR
jgi:NAD(P)-dependent dehydrogenase (short-subunit alcohol dehydrogenase family)